MSHAIRPVLSIYTLFAVLGAGPVCATEFCVSTEAELRTALATPQAAGRNDAIHLVRGVYHTGGTPFQYTQTSAHSFQIDGGWSPGCTQQNRRGGSTILDGDGTSGVFSAGVAQYTATEYEFRVENLTFQNGNAATGANVDLTTQTQTTWFRYNIVRNNRGSAGLALNMGGSTGTQRHVSNSLFVANGGTQVVAGPGHTAFVNDTFVGEGVSARGVPGHSTLSYVYVANSLFRGQTDYDLSIGYEGGSTWTHTDYCSTYSEFSLMTYPVACASTSTTFGGPGYHLAASAAADLDQGASDLPSPIDTYDLDGNPRVSGAGIDLGAYERGESIFNDTFE